MVYPLSEQHPREQGLKHTIGDPTDEVHTPLSEQHPREQGLKHLAGDEFTRYTTTFRATSKRTRIETGDGLPRYLPGVDFQSNIQENKD